MRRGSPATARWVVRLTTLPMTDGKIIQELSNRMGDIENQMTRWIMDTRENGVREALVQLGWTPPSQDGDRSTHEQI